LNDAGCPTIGFLIQAIHDSGQMSGEGTNEQNCKPFNGSIAAEAAKVRRLITLMFAG
jgi:hypothetical protein